MSIKLKKSWLITSFSMILFGLISVSIAQAANNHVFVTVLYNDNCPRQGAIVKIYDRIPDLMGYCNDPSYTNASGQCNATGMTLSPGTVYKAIAYYPPNTYWYEMLFQTDGNGNGQVTITKSENYLNLTEPCGEGACTGYKQCVGNPKYVECNSSNTDCSVCALCDGSGSCNVYDETQDLDCSATPCPDACDKDANLSTFDYANDEPNYCSGLDQCTSNSCNYQHACADTNSIDDIFNWESIIRTCNAQCDQNSDCASGICNSDCTCYIDTTPPTITIISPENKTYYATSIPLTFTVNEPTSWCGYSLDGKANVTLPGCANKTITGLSNGQHNIMVYANDTSGNMGSSSKVYFKIPCTCTDWKKASESKQTSCRYGLRYECTVITWKRTCTPSGCDREYMMGKYCTEI
jgi:hypothetical protein